MLKQSIRQFPNTFRFFEFAGLHLLTAELQVHARYVQTSSQRSTSSQTFLPPFPLVPFKKVSKVDIHPAKKTNTFRTSTPRPSFARGPFGYGMGKRSGCRALPRNSLFVLTQLSSLAGGAGTIINTRLEDRGAGHASEPRGPPARQSKAPRRLLQHLDKYSLTFSFSNPTISPRFRRTSLNKSSPNYSTRTMYDASSPLPHVQPILLNL